MHVTLTTSKTLLFHQCLSGLLMRQHREDVSVSVLTRCHGRPHDKEHPHCNPLQRGGQQAATFQDGIHHFVLKGNQHEDEQCVKHGEPGSREAKLHLGDPGEKDEVKPCKKQQSMTTPVNVSASQHSSPCVCVHVCESVCTRGLILL